MNQWPEENLPMKRYGATSVVWPSRRESVESVVTELVIVAAVKMADGQRCDLSYR